MLPGLAPHHTRGSFGSESRLYVEKYAPTTDDFLLTEEGLWLLPTSIAERDLTAGINKLGDLALSQEAAGLDSKAVATTAARDTLKGTEVTEAGCLVGGLNGLTTPGAMALFLAEQELRTFALDKVEDMPDLRVCDCDACYNSRHYDIDFGRLTLRERTMEVNPNWYIRKNDGGLETIWGDKLPSIADSLQYFIKLQRKNYPFVPYSASHLTASGISQIRFQPYTGCWESWSYYCRTDESLNWQFDGYGRLYQRNKRGTVDAETGEITNKQRRGHWMAHRVVWEATGRKLLRDKVLNHKCSYRRCCNPLHIEQVTASQNVRHGLNVQEAMRTQLDYEPDAKDAYMTPSELKQYELKAKELYVKLAL